MTGDCQWINITIACLAKHYSCNSNLWTAVNRAMGSQPIPDTTVAFVNQFECRNTAWQYRGNSFEKSKLKLQTALEKAKHGCAPSYQSLSLCASVVKLRMFELLHERSLTLSSTSRHCQQSVPYSSCNVLLHELYETVPAAMHWLYGMKLGPCQCVQARECSATLCKLTWPAGTTADQHTSHVSNCGFWHTFAFLLVLLALPAEQAAVWQYNHSSPGTEPSLLELADPG